MVKKGRSVDTTDSEAQGGVGDERASFFSGKERGIVCAVSWRHRQAISSLEGAPAENCWDRRARLLLQRYDEGEDDSSASDGSAGGSGTSDDCSSDYSWTGEASEPHVGYDKKGSSLVLWAPHSLTVPRSAGKVTGP